MSYFIRKLWSFVCGVRPWVLSTIYGMHIGKNTKIARTAHLDRKVNPKGIHIGDNTWILANVMILAHDHCQGANKKGKLFDTYIGKNCVHPISQPVMF